MLFGEGKAVVNTVVGIGSAAVGIGTAVVSAGLHPVDTAKHVTEAVLDPIGTATSIGAGAVKIGKAVVADVVDKAESGLDGQGELAGDAILIVFGPSLVAKSAGKVAAVARLARGAAEGEQLAAVAAAAERATGSLEAGIAEGLTAEAAPIAEGVAPIADNVGGALGGTAYSSEKLKSLGEYLGRRGVSLKVGDQFLPPGTSGGFVAKADGTAELILPSNPTQYQVWHELGHYVQWKDLGSDAYRALPRWSPSNPVQDIPEQFVFDLLENSKGRRWDQLTFEEQQHAIEYVLKKGGIR